LEFPNSLKSKDMKTEPTEALKEIKRCSWEVDFNISDGLESYEVVDKDDAINIANIAFKEGQSSPKIKQLEWEFYGLYYDVETAVGHYMILQGDEQCWENYNTCTLTHNGSLIADFNSVDEAKAAAQADFERRVRECLD
jgi:hypothetical protein